MDISRNKHRRKGEVNIVPLVDVFTALIFFFLLTMQFKDIYAVDITPPTMQSSESAAERKPNTLAITKDGKLFFNTEEIGEDALSQKLSDIAKSEDSSLVLLADEQTPLHFVTSAIDKVKLAKIKKLSLQTNK